MMNLVCIYMNEDPDTRFTHTYTYLSSIFSSVHQSTPHPLHLYLYIRNMGLVDMGRKWVYGRKHNRKHIYDRKHQAIYGPRHKNTFS